MKEFHSVASWLSVVLFLPIVWAKTFYDVVKT